VLGQPKSMITLDNILHARENIQEDTVRTPLVFSSALTDQFNANIHVKLENLQTTGSFKLRGSTNRIAELSSEQRSNGIVTVSSGNHAQGVALAATRSNIDSVIVMPESTPETKREATQKYGGRVIIHGADYQESSLRARKIEQNDGRTYIPTFDDWDVIAGQGTIGLEIIEDVPEPDIVVVPVGGGGLISGIATAVKAKSPDTRVIGVEADGASTVAESLNKGELYELESVDTVADGIAINSLGQKPLEVINELVDEVVTVDDQAIETSITNTLMEGKVLVEGAGAAPLAAISGRKFDYDDDDTIVPVLSGGNIDRSLLQRVLGTSS
jgi:threonine dehydratase